MNTLAWFYFNVENTIHVKFLNKGDEQRHSLLIIRLSFSYLTSHLPHLPT